MFEFIKSCSTLECVRVLFEKVGPICDRASWPVLVL